jgi:ATP-dependent Clp protease ATP-binding subunit ClpC
LKDFGTGVGFNTSAKSNQQDDAAQGVIQNALKKAFAPEFLNRIDDIVLFNSLERHDIHNIIDIELAKLYKRVTDLGYTVKLSDEAKDYIADQGFDAQYGARPLKRAIQKLLEDQLAEEIINSNMVEGDTIKVGLDKKENKLKFSIVKAKESKEEAKED